jgi:hypothetical protein
VEGVQLSSLSQILSALAVVASLVFVGIQLRHATRAVRASTSQAHSANYYAINSNIIGDGELARIWRESFADFDSQGPDAKVRFVALASSIFRFYESSRAQWFRGQLDPEHWQMIERQATSFASQPGIKSWWNLRRQWHSAEFRTWFEALPEAEGGTLYAEASERRETAAMALRDFAQQRKKPGSPLSRG